MPNWNGDWIEVKSYDVEQSGSAGVGDSGGLEVRMEYDTGTPITRHIGMLFSTSGVTGTVSSATLTLNIDGTDLPTGSPGTSLNVRVYAVDQGDTLSLPTTIEDYAALPRTTAYASRSFFGEDATTSLDINVASVVQEVFDRIDWFSGAGIALLVEVQSGSAQPYYLTLQSIDPSSLSISTATIVDCATGTFTLTGNAATFNNQSTIGMGTGSFILTGQPATFDASLSVAMAAGTFALSGQTTRVDVTANLGTGTFTCAAGEVTFPNIRAILADTGTFALTGIANNWTTSLTMAPGSFTLTGVAAVLGAISTIDCSVGSFTLTGVSNNWVTSLSIATGTFAMTGQAAGVEAVRNITAETGTFLVSGQDATVAAVFPLVCATGEFTLMGYGMAFDSNGIIDALPGVFVMTGSEVTFPTAYTWALEAAAFTFAGVDAGVGWVQPFNLEAATFVVAGQTSSLPATYQLVATTEAIIVSSYPINISDPTASGGGSVFTKKKALLECGCGCEPCRGCCFPWELMEGERIPQAMPFAISAPGCLELDGFECTFQPYFDDNILPGTCGWCADAPSDCNGDESVEIVGTVYADSGGICITTPCGLFLQFALECQNQDEDIGGDSCSESLRLIIKINWDAPNSYIGPYAPFGPGDHTMLSIEPSSHECLDDPNGGLLAVFDLSVISFSCGQVHVGNACEGFSSCCQPNTCDLTGATLTVG